jgi:hypothetical protein
MELAVPFRTESSRERDTVKGKADMSIFGRRVLRVRLCQDAPAWIFPTVEVAASALRAHGLRAIVDHVPAGYRDRTNLSWTEDQEVAEVLKLFAGGVADDPLAEEMAAAWSLAFYTMHRFFTRLEGEGRRWDRSAPTPRLQDACDPEV